jgi:pimeloyl-ACP methyl ester carboxylesterase
MPECAVNGVRLHYDERGSGDPILCIHGAGSSTQLWADAVEKLAELGRVIAYDRRGCSRSERPEPYERTSVSEHADDAAALLEALDAAPAVIIGRSYGGTIALDLAIRHPELVRAIAVLEGDAPRELAPATADWIEAVAGRVREAAERYGVDGVGETLIEEILGDGVWPQLPEPMRRVLTENGPALLAELGGEWWLDADAEALARLEQPALLVAAADSRAELREPTEALAGVLPGARIVVVAGGHMIDPAAPDVLAFVGEVLAGR